MASLSRLEGLFSFCSIVCIRLKIVHSKIKKWNLVLVDKGTHQKETITKWPIWLALNDLYRVSLFNHMSL